MRLRPRKFLALVPVVIVFAACGSQEDTAKPIVFSGAQTTRSATGAANESVADAPADSKMAIAPYSVEYSVAGELQAFDDAAQSWKSSTEPTEKMMKAVASALGVDGELKARAKDMGGGFVAGPTDGSAPSVSFGSDAYNSWYYSPEWSSISKEAVSTQPAIAADTPASSTDSSGSVDATVPSTDRISPPDTVAAPKNLPTKAAAREAAMKIADAAGVDVRDTDVEVIADDWSVSVTMWPHAGDIRVPLPTNVGFGENAKISWASGNLVKFVKGPKFPRVGTEAGVKRLGDPKYSGWFGYGAVARGVASDVALPAIDSAPSTDQTTNESVAPVQVQKIVLTGVKESLTPIVDKDGVLWLLPSYEYTAKDGYTVGVLAITDDYIDQSQINSGSDVPTSDEGGAAGSSSGSSGAGSAPSGGVVAPPASSGSDALALSNDEAKKLVGLTEDEANKFAVSNGWVFRIGARDGESFAVTDDFVTNRVTVTIVGGKVTDVSVG